jgi:hypothetical protein
MRGRIKKQALDEQAKTRGFGSWRSFWQTSAKPSFKAPACPTPNTRALPATTRAYAPPAGF